MIRPRDPVRGRAMCSFLVAFGTALLPLPAILCGADPPAVASRPEHLSANLRVRFDSLRDELRQAEQTLLQAEADAAAAQPARAVARDFVARARAEEARTAPLVAAIRTEYAGRGPDADLQFQQWLTCDLQQAARERVDQMQASDRDRILLVWYARHLLTQMTQRPAALPPALRETIPEAPDALTDTEVIESFRKVHERLVATSPIDCAQAEQVVALSRQTRELVRQASIAAFDLSIAIDCVNAHTPDSVVAAERKITELNTALSEVWPGWATYESEVAKTRFHDEHPAAAHKEFTLKHPPLPVQPAPSRIPWIVGSLILLAGAVGYMGWTSRSNRPK